MGRKPKSETPVQEEVVPVEQQTESIPSQDDTPTTTEQTEEYTPVGTVTLKPEDITQDVGAEMCWAMGEINRCNDYIYAKADLDRRFTVYRDELYEYRYKLRQLSLLDNYPYISKTLLPVRPDVVQDV